MTISMLRRTSGLGFTLASSIVAASAAFAASAPPVPARAAGLWELKHIGGGGTEIGTQTVCVSAETEATSNLFSLIAENVNCSKYQISQDGDKLTFDFVCGPAEMTSTSKGTVSGNFTSAYTVEMTESDGTMELSRTIKATHKGECPDGNAPGTVTTKVAE